MSTAAPQQKSPERGVSSIVKEAVRQAHKSTPSEQVNMPTGLVVKTTFEHREDTLARALKSPTLSEIDQLLAPTFESGSVRESNVVVSGSLRGSSVGSTSVNGSEDIIRKVELEIETARKAATEAHARLAVASGTFDGLDSLDDNDFMQDILSVSSVEEFTAGDENKPEGYVETKGPVVKEDQTEHADSAPTGSPVSDGIPDVPMQRTFESGVELALEDTIEAMHTNKGVASFDLDLSETGMASNNLTQDENDSNGNSDYTEETVTDDENSIVTDYETSEYSEESVTDDGEHTADNSEPMKEARHTGDHVPSEQLSSVSYDSAEEKKEKPWFAGTRGWFGGGGEELRPVTPRGLIGSPQSTPKSPATAVNVTNGHGKDAKVLWVSPFQAERPATETKSQSPEGGVSAKSKENSNLWLLDPKVKSNESMAPVCENAKSPILPASGVGLDTTASNSEEAALRALIINTAEADPAEKSDAQDKISASQVQFRYPYPVPPKVPKPRPASEIIKDYSLGTPERVVRWVQPKPELEELLLAVKGDSMPRRSNACGALKVLLARQPKNVFALVRTVGFLEALVFACSEDVISSPEMETALIARSRAATTIMKVSEPKENRVLVTTEPGLPECLVKVVMEDTGEARAHACAALAMLAKTPANRELMVDVKDLVNVLAQVVNGAINLTLGPAVQEEKKEEAQGPFGFGSSSFTSAGEDSCDGMEAMSTGASSSASPPVSTVNFRPDSIRKHKDGKQEEYTMQSKHHACATLMHLSKHCPISDKLCANLTLMDSLVKISRSFDSPLHTKCIEIICNLTRFPANAPEMARDDVLVDALFKCGKSRTIEDRVWAMRALQNMASHSANKITLANSKILTLLSICAMRQDEEQVAAVATLYNLSTEPGAVVPITNTRNVVATLVHLAHNAQSPPDVRRLSCESLATIGLWLQTLAGSGTVPEGISKVLLPTHKTTGWQRWD